MIHRVKSSGPGPSVARVPALLAALVLATAVAWAADLIAYESPAGGFSLGYPAGFEVDASTAQTRFYLPDADGPRSALTFVEVRRVRADEPWPEALLFEKDGLSKWVAATRPRYEVEDRRRPKVGPKGEAREALLTKDPESLTAPDRRELIVLVPAKDGAFVIRCSAPLARWSAQDAVWKQVLESFKQ